MPMTISSSWVVLSNGAVRPARGGRRDYTPKAKADLVCVVCQAKFRGRSGREYCTGRCRSRASRARAA